MDRWCGHFYYTAAVKEEPRQKEGQAFPSTVGPEGSGSWVASSRPWTKQAPGGLLRVSGRFLGSRSTAPQYSREAPAAVSTLEFLPSGRGGGGWR